MIRIGRETRWLPRTQEQLLGERARDGRLADRFLAGEAVRVRHAAGAPVSLQDRDGAVVARDRRKTASNRDSIPTSPRGWHGAHLNKSFLDDAEAPLLSCWRFRQQSCQLLVRRIPSPPGLTTRQRSESDGCRRNRTDEENSGCAGNEPERPDRTQRMPVQDRLRIRVRLPGHLLS